jgi:predicted HTH transcriptional regulator
MNGFEFAKQALLIMDYELDQIVELTDTSEVDWLEFKAAIKAENSEDREEGNDADFILNLLKALISMANSAGGMVVLGIDDNGQAVGLEPSGFNGNKDKFTLALTDKVFAREGWRTKLSGHWRWKHQIDQFSFDPQWAKYCGVDVLVFTVKPRERVQGPLVLTKSMSKNSELEEVVLMRLGGDRGRVEKMTPKLVEPWWEGVRDPYQFSTKFKKWILQL